MVAWRHVCCMQVRPADLHDVHLKILPIICFRRADSNEEWISLFQIKGQIKDARSAKSSSLAKTKELFRS